MRDASRIEELKNHPRYHNKDKISFTKSAQKKLHDEFSNTNWDLAYAISSGKTIPKPYFKIHWCSKHGIPVNKEHMDKCNVIKLPGNNKLPSHYNEFWSKK